MNTQVDPFVRRLQCLSCGSEWWSPTDAPVPCPECKHEGNPIDILTCHSPEFDRMNRLKSWRPQWLVERDEQAPR